MSDQDKEEQILENTAQIVENKNVPSETCISAEVKNDNFFEAINKQVKKILEPDLSLGLESCPGLRIEPDPRPEVKKPALKALDPSLERRPEPRSDLKELDPSLEQEPRPNLKELESRSELKDLDPSLEPEPTTEPKDSKSRPEQSMESEPKPEQNEPMLKPKEQEPRPEQSLKLELRPECSLNSEPRQKQTESEQRLEPEPTPDPKDPKLRAELNEPEQSLESKPSPVLKEPEQSLESKPSSVLKEPEQSLESKPSPVLKKPEQSPESRPELMDPKLSLRSEPRLESEPKPELKDSELKPELKKRKRSVESEPRSEPKEPLQSLKSTLRLDLKQPELRLLKEPRPRQTLWKLGAAIVLFVIVMWVLQLHGTSTLDSKSALQIFQDEFISIQKDFPGQNRDLWLRSEKMLKNHLNKTHPSEPATIILAAAQDAKRTLLCLGSGLAQAYAVALNASWLLIHGPDEAIYDDSTAKLHIDEKLSSGFRSTHRAAVLDRLETLPPGSLLILYKYCDHENAAHKDVALVFTVLLEDSSLEPDIPLPNLEEKVRDFLWKKFIVSGTKRSHQEMDSDKLGGVWSRISHLVLPVLPVNSIEFGNCPFNHGTD